MYFEFTSLLNSTFNIEMQKQENERKKLPENFQKLLNSYSDSTRSTLAFIL